MQNDKNVDCVAQETLQTSTWGFFKRTFFIDRGEKNLCNLHKYVFS